MTQLEHPDMRRTGILLFAHGARDPQWALPFEAVATRLRQQVGPDAGAASELSLIHI